MATLFLLSLFISFSPQQKSLHQFLDPFNANWRGEFKVYRFDGKLIDQLEVEQRYSWKGDEQYGVFTERQRNGKVVHPRYCLRGDIEK